MFLLKIVVNCSWNIHITKVLTLWHYLFGLLFFFTLACDLSDEGYLPEITLSDAS